MVSAVEIRGGGSSALRAVVRAGLPLLRAALEELDRSLPRHVERELEGFLSCGDPAMGFAWLWCEACAHHRLVAFSCKRRGFCPSCGGRRMAERAAWWIDRVLPRVATRQWVLTVPWKRRALLARRPDLARGVHAVAMREIERWYAREAGAREGKGGSVTAIKRFGSALNLNLHYHVIALDGVFVRRRDGRLSFRRGIPHTADIEALVERIAASCEGWLARRGVGPDEAEEIDDEDAAGVLQQASLLGYSVLGERAGQRVRRVQTLGGREVALPPRCAASGGYNLHAGVSFGARDRRGLERLCRYVLRPPLAQDRLQPRGDGTYFLAFKRLWSDGTAGVVLSPLELLERLVAVIPPPRANQVLYRGVLAANAAWRAEVVPRAPREAGERPAKLTRTPSGKRSGVAGWAALLRRVFGVDALACPGCGGRLALRGVVVNPPATTRIVAGLTRERGPPGGAVAETSG